MKKIILAAALSTLLSSTSYAAGGAKVFFKNLKDGEIVTSPVKVEMGVEGKTLAKAGSQSENEGHHHIIIDGAPLERGQVVPTDAQHIHFGQAQTETLVELAPGKHTLTLQFADGSHRSFGKELSATVNLQVMPK